MKPRSVVVLDRKELRRALTEPRQPHFPTRRAALRYAIDQATWAAAELAFDAPKDVDSERTEAEQAFEVLVALGDAIELRQARALGALRSGARAARKHLPTSHVDADAILLHEVKSLISNTTRPTGVAVTELALNLAVRIKSRGAIIPAFSITPEHYKTFVGDAERVERAIQRFVTGERIFVAELPHVAGASPRKRARLCRCIACVAARIITAAKRALAG